MVGLGDEFPLRQKRPPPAQIAQKNQMRPIGRFGGRRGVRSVALRELLARRQRTGRVVQIQHDQLGTMAARQFQAGFRPPRC
jgi:hypothetical protein